LGEKKEGWESDPKELGEVQKSHLKRITLPLGGEGRHPVSELAERERGTKRVRGATGGKLKSETIQGA